MKNNKELLAAIELEKQKAAGVKSSVKDWLKLNKPGKVEEYNEERMFQIAHNPIALMGVQRVALDFGDIDFDRNLVFTGFQLIAFSMDTIADQIRQLGNAEFQVFMNGGRVNNRPSGTPTMPNSTIPAYQRFAFGPSSPRVATDIVYNSGDPQLAWSGSASFPVVGVADEDVYAFLSVYYKLRP